MKTLLNLILSSLILISVSCSTSKFAASNTDDDIYYSSKDPKPLKEKIEPTQPTEQSQAAASQENDPKYKEKDFNYDDYYDYEYAARLKRFHNPYPANSYYDDYYTNSYWYNNNPFYAGVSIYLGYSWWGSTYSMYSYNPGYFTGYDPFWSPYSYRPWWSTGYGYCPGYSYGSPYGYGFQQGYMNGYSQGYLNNYYFNSYDDNSYHYGPRRTAASNGNRNVASSEPLGQRYQQEVGVTEPSRSFEQSNSNSLQPTYLNNTRPGNNEGISLPKKDLNARPVYEPGSVSPEPSPGNTLSNEPGSRPVKKFEIQSEPARPEPRPSRNTYQAAPSPVPAPSSTPRSTGPRSGGNSPRR